MNHRTTALLVAALSMAILLLTACSNDTAKESSEPFNDADVEFALHAGTHLSTTVTTAQTAQQDAHRPQVRRLARRILTTLGPHADTISGWVLSWGEKGAAVGHGDDTHATSTGADAFDDRTLAKMSSTNGPRFDQLYVTALIDHLADGRTIWRDEIENGAHDKAMQLAQQLLDEQAELRDTASRALAN